MNLFCGKKKWDIENYDVAVVEEMCQKYGISDVLAKILLKREISDQKTVADFFDRRELKLYNPFLLQDMKKACNRICAALDNGEKICIYGDYDVDGITATALMYSYLKSHGGNVIYYIPERLTEGYGMNCVAVEKLAKCGVNLIITVDNGITANAETAYAEKLNMDVVITDHHECLSELPNCCAVVNPKRADNAYPIDFLAGVGVAFKLICALEGEKADEEFINKYIGLVALGTISDVMPLKDENRRMVLRGLMCLEKCCNPGIAVLLHFIAQERGKTPERRVSSSTVGYTIAPRLNAAGRIGNVKKAVELLITEDVAVCKSIAMELCEKNRERQITENRILEEAIAIIESEHDFEKNKIIVLSSEKWHHGVVGIVASRITEKYSVPTVFICCENGIGKGSARSVKGFNINEAIHSCADILIKHGGHELAAGLTLDVNKIPEFRKRINDYARERLGDDMMLNFVEIDAELDGKDISVSLCEELAELEPCGTANPVPLFCMKDVEIKSVVPLGKNKHIKLCLCKDGYEFDGLLFGVSPKNFFVPDSGKADFAFNLDLNEFRGMKNPQAIIREVCFCDEDELKYAENAAKVDEILLGKYPYLVPDINVFRCVYRYLLKLESCGGLEDFTNLYILWRDMFINAGIEIEFSSLIAIIEIFENVGLVKLTKKDYLTVKIQLLKVDGKIDLENCELLLRARNIG